MTRKTVAWYYPGICTSLPKYQRKWPPYEYGLLSMLWAPSYIWNHITYDINCLTFYYLRTPVTHERTFHASWAPLDLAAKHVMSSRTWTIITPPVVRHLGCDLSACINRIRQIEDRYLCALTHKHSHIHPRSHTHIHIHTNSTDHRWRNFDVASCPVWGLPVSSSVQSHRHMGYWDRRDKIE